MNTDYVLSWKSKGLPDETITPYATSDNSLTPLIDYCGSNIRVKFPRSCLKQSKLSYTHGKIVNIYIVYELGASTSDNNDPTLKKCLFGAVILTKNTDIDKYRYSGYGIGFDRRSNFSFPGGGFSQNVLIFGLDMSYSSHIDTKKKRHISSRKRTNIRIRTCEKMYSINFTVTKKKFCLSLYYNAINSCV